MKTVLACEDAIQEHALKSGLPSPLNYVTFPLLPAVNKVVPVELPTTLVSTREVTKRAVSELVDIATISEVVLKKLASGADDVHVDEDPFFVGDLGEVVRQYRRWIKNLPRIEPFFAIKCNPDPMVLHTLVKLGVGFDCASRVTNLE